VLEGEKEASLSMNALDRRRDFEGELHRGGKPKVQKRRSEYSMGNQANNLGNGEKGPGSWGVLRPLILSSGLKKTQQGSIKYNEIYKENSTVSKAGVLRGNKRLQKREMTRQRRPRGRERQTQREVKMKKAGGTS